MTNQAVTSTAESGYNFAQFHFRHLELKRVPNEEVAPDSEENSLAMGWDWSWVDRNGFDVIVSTTIMPTSTRPERIEATIVGRFEIIGAVQTVSVEQFAQFGAPALLFPYIRQHITLLTAAGQGALLLPPLNIHAMMQSMEPNSLGGARSPRPD